MGNVILCQVRRAEYPWYLENIGFNIYSVEELCYFICNNLPLVDESIMSNRMTDWIKTELRLHRLAHHLEQVLEGGCTVNEFVMPILREINYLGQREMVSLEQKIQELSEQPEPVRIKKKGDTLLANKKYIRALKSYQDALAFGEHSVLGSQFVGSVYNNQGCAYAGMFRMEEACSCFLKSYGEIHTFDVLKRYLFSVYLKDGEKAYSKLLDEYGVDEGRRKKLAEEIAAVEVPEVPGDMDAALKKWTAEYHRSTDM